MPAGVCDPKASPGPHEDPVRVGVQALLAPASQLGRQQCPVLQFWWDGGSQEEAAFLPRRDDERWRWVGQLVAAAGSRPGLGLRVWRECYLVLRLVPAAGAAPRLR